MFSYNTIFVAKFYITYDYTIGLSLMYDISGVPGYEDVFGYCIYITCIWQFLFFFKILSNLLGDNRYINNI